MTCGEKWTSVTCHHLGGDCAHVGKGRQNANSHGFIKKGAPLPIPFRASTDGLRSLPCLRVNANGFVLVNFGDAHIKFPHVFGLMRVIRFRVTDTVLTPSIATYILSFTRE